MTVLQQPKVLKVLFLTEMWERFGFYTLQAMLVFYLMNKLSFTEAKAYTTLGLFNALAFITPVVGGLIADRFLGCRFSVLFGAFSLFLGYAFLALSTHTLYWGLALVICGNGLLKPNISSFLGQFYSDNDSRRETGFTLFYVGICLGITLATVSTGYIKFFAGWGACFGAASFAMLIGGAVFRFGYKWFADKGFPPKNNGITWLTFLKKNPLTLVGFIAAIFLLNFLMLHPNVSHFIIYGFTLVFVIYIMLASAKLDAVTCGRLRILLIFFALGTVFWALFFEMFFAVNVFTEKAVNRYFLGYAIPTPFFLSFETLFILPIGPFFALLWRKEIIKVSKPVKFSFGLFFMAFSLQSLAWMVPNSGSQMLAACLLLFYLLVTIADLLISPVILSLITEYVPYKYSNVMMGGWFLSYGCAGKVTAFLAQYSIVPNNITDLSIINGIYKHAFQIYAWIGFATFLFSVLLWPLMRRKLTPI